MGWKKPRYRITILGHKTIRPPGYGLWSIAVRLDARWKLHPSRLIPSSDMTCFGFYLPEHDKARVNS